MVDINFIRAHREEMKNAIRLKKIDINLENFFSIDTKRTVLLREVEELRRKKNENANSIKTGPSDPMINIVEGKRIKNDIQIIEKKFIEIDEEFNNYMVRMPTVPAPDTPKGTNDLDNIEVRKWGNPPQFKFIPKDHIELGRDLDLLDMEKGVKVSGYRGYYVKNEAVMIQMGVMMHALQKAVSRGFMPMIPPTLVKEFALFGSGYFKGKSYNADIDEIYQIANNDKLADGTLKKENKFLVGTAEPSLLAYFANEMIDVNMLPLKLCGFSQCYRSEIGSYGKDTKGMYRVHEFMKVELVCITKADIGAADLMHEEMIALSRELHEDLGLPYRQLRICAGDLSVGKYKQYDMEAWIPSRNGYGETGSASNFLDWQARRLNIRYRDHDGNINYAYLLNDTALPSPRILISILENYQQEDGSIHVPEILQTYVGKIIINGKKYMKHG